MTMGLAALAVTICIITLGIVDLALVVYGLWSGKSTQSTVSNFLIKLGLNVPSIVFVFGFVAGHLFGYMYPAECPNVTACIFAPNFYMKLSGVLVILLIISVYRHTKLLSKLEDKDL